MTYFQPPVPNESVTSEELVYSPFVSNFDNDFEAEMMGGYEFPAGRLPASIETRPSAPSRRVMQVPGGFVPPGYKLVPLSGSESGSGMSTGKKIAIAVAVIIVVGAIIYYIKQQKTKSPKPAITPTQAVKKMPTSRLAQNLYTRLAKNGRVSRSTLAALDEIAQE